MCMKSTLVLSALATVPFLVPLAHATTVTYTNQNTFFTAAGTHTTQNFDNFATGTVITNQLSGITSVTTNGNNGSTQAQIGSVSTLPFPMTEGLPTSSGTQFLSSELAPPTYATAHLDFNFSANQDALGLYVVDGAPLGDFIITLFEGASTVGVLDFGPQTLPNSFVGVTSTVAFNRADVGSANTGDSFGIDDLSYAAVPTGTPGPVPEPASILLAGAGSALALFRRMRTRGR